jgi:5-methylcytosine-specific restriction enzyme A
MFCEKCSMPIHLVLSEVTDHKIPHKGDMILFWDHRNWQGLCKRCHDIKTASEDGGMGNPLSPL